MQGINIISWLLAASVPLAPSDVGLEPHEQTELILWLIAAAISLVPVVIFFVSYLRVKSTGAIDSDVRLLHFLFKGDDFGNETLHAKLRG